MIYHSEPHMDLKEAPVGREEARMGRRGCSLFRGLFHMSDASGKSEDKFSLFPLFGVLDEEWVFFASLSVVFGSFSDFKSFVLSRRDRVLRESCGIRQPCRQGRAEDRRHHRRHQRRHGRPSHARADDSGRFRPLFHLALGQKRRQVRIVAEMKGRGSKCMLHRIH